MLLPATPGWVSLPVMVGGPRHSCVCSGGADKVTGGALKPLRLGPLPASLVGPFRPGPLFALWFAVVGFPSIPGGVVVVGGAFRRCVCLLRGAVCVGVCLVRSWWRGCGCVLRVCWCLCVHVWVCGPGRLGLADGVGVGVVGVCPGWSLATPGGGS